MSIAEPGTRALLRRAALRSALRSGDALAAARAWERLRIGDTAVPREEAAAARAARAAVGRALRDARRRRAYLPPEPVVAPSALPAPRLARSRRALAVAALAALATVLALAVVPRPPATPDAPAAAPPAPAAIPLASIALSGGRGRTSATLAPIATPPPATPLAQPSAPVAAASGAPSAGTGSAPGGTSGGAPSGAPTAAPAGGVGAPTGRPSATPVPVVNVLPVAPPTLPRGSDRFLFRVVDYVTGAPLPNVCVIYGTLQCGPADPHTGANGYYWFDLQSGYATQWGFLFSLDGYLTGSANKTYTPGIGTATTTVFLTHR